MSSYQQRSSDVQYSSEADPFRLSLTSWQLWALAASLVILAAGVCATLALLQDAPNESGAVRVGLAVGVPMLVVALPGALLLVALLAPSPVTRSRVFTAATVVLGAFTVLYVPLQGLMVLGHNVTASKARYEAAKDEAKKVVEDVVGKTNDLGQELLKSGGLNPRTMTSEKVIDERLALVRKLRKSNDETITKLSSMDGQVNAVFEKYGVSNKDREAYWKSPNDGGEWLRTAQQSRELDRQMLKEMETYLSILRDQFGKWEIAGNGVMSFDYDDAKNGFNASSQRLDSLVAKQNALWGKRR
jgi:hypothetical protein